MDKQEKKDLLCEYCQKQCFVYVNGIKTYCDVYYTQFKKKE